jgi:DNA-binding NarL/FixJ family response regulator
MASNAAIRILLADDHQLLADACKGLLEPEFEVVAVVTDGRSLLEQAALLKPDVIVLDISMPHLNGLDASSALRHRFPAIKLIILTMNMAPEVAAEAFRRGVSGYVLKHTAAEELLIAVRRVVQGASYLSPLLTKETVNFLLSRPESRAEDKQITQRQSEILQLLAEGNSMKQVASIVDIKPGTVAFHKYRMMEKLNIKSNAELLEYAIKRQMAR